MKSKSLFSYLLLAALFVSLLSLQNANSQSATITTTTTITEPPSGQCSEISLAFSAQAGRQIVGTFGSDAAVNFYILSQQDYNAIQNPNCSLPPSSRPLFSELNSVGHDNSYRSLTLPANGTYYFVFVLTSKPGHLTSGFAKVELAFPASVILVTTGASSSVIVTSTQLTQSTQPTQSTQLTQSSQLTQGAQLTQSISQGTTVTSNNLPFGTFGIIGVIVAVGLIASVMVFMRRGKSQAGQKTVLKQETLKEEAKPESLQPRETQPAQNISTGYPELDNLLAGGLPVGFAILLVSPPCDERDLLFRKIIESSLSMGSSVFFLSRDLGRTQDFAGRYDKNFYVFSPQADKITPPSANVFKIQSVQNLSDVNISFAKAVETLPKTSPGRLILIDLLSDVLLEHKALMTRKWLDDFIGKRKSEGFTILGVLNPMISSKQDTQTIMDLFDGIIEIYERELRERARRFLIVKKMYGRRYVETELMLDKDKLY
ncbi:MAG: hypothetical protein WB661_07365 [Candidatus Bathyarchaeia archaeon]